LWALRPGAWLQALIVGGVLMLVLNSMLLFGDGNSKNAAPTGLKIFHLVCMAIGAYTLMILLLPRGQAIFQPEREARQLARNSSPQEIALEEEQPDQAEVYAKPKIVFTEKAPLKSKLYVAGVIVLVAALAGLGSLDAGRAGLFLFGTVLLLTLGLISVFAYVSFSGKQIVCDEKGFEVSESGAQRRRILAVRRGSVVLFLVSLIVLVVFMNFFNTPGPASTYVMILILGCLVGIVLGFTGFLLGKNMDLTAGEEVGKRRFGWRQVTDTQIFPVDDAGNFIFVVRAGEEEILSYASSAQNFRNLLRVFNENAAHLPFLWVDAETINRREIVENVEETYFKVSRHNSVPLL
jgi:hypothetical protein